MLALVTRPREQALHWVAQLQTRGVSAKALPLIDIGDPVAAAPVVAAWRNIAKCTLVMFVSANAVQRFFAMRPVAATWPAGLRAAATGPGTTAALRAAGLAPAQIVAPSEAGPLESEALWQVLSPEPWSGTQVLVVRGDEGRDWLAERWRERGAKVSFLASYRRLLPHWPAVEARLCDEAIAQPGAAAWLFSSSQAVHNLRQLRPLADLAQATAVATHERIAAAAHAIGFAQVQVVAPQIDAVAALLKRLDRGPSVQSKTP